MTTSNTWARIREATTRDLPALGVLAAELVRLHHRFDPLRFFLARGIEEGYRDWFARELQNADAILLVAEDAGGECVGYAYGRIEGRDWNSLLDRHAVLHDILVREGERRTGAGALLLRAFCDRARQREVPRVVLFTAYQNHSAQALFAKHGFRPTMLEMTCELGEPARASDL